MYIQSGLELQPLDELTSPCGKRKMSAVLLFTAELEHARANIRWIINAQEEKVERRRDKNAALKQEEKNYEEVDSCYTILTRLYN